MKGKKVYLMKYERRFERFFLKNMLRENSKIFPRKLSVQISNRILMFGNFGQQFKQINWKEQGRSHAVPNLTPHSNIKMTN